jgi:hypothetical protein|tara:strand:- start:1905 stop:2330 length:426 start_codon:yes stop_codon:yes gene_type:complete
MAFAINAALVENGENNLLIRPIEKEKINKHNLNDLFGKNINKSKIQPSETDISDIHKKLKEDNKEILTDFYKSSEYGKNNVDNLDVNLDDNSKLNNILEILENQKEIRTEQKTEEIILFFFIGIFIIYIIDSFASIGKYSR